ncbi:MAG TPA: hypothetical protein VK619_08650, partial [Pyrinomonadaceae bacterium]|nr:hypothetical protein [Pyrinomonadaceae bacterium]
MRVNKRSPLVSLLIAFSMLLSVCSGAIIGKNAGAQSASGSAQPGATAKRRNSYPLLSRYATDVTRLARQGRLEPVTGRDAEINRTIRILSNEERGNPVLISEQEVNTAVIASGIAQRIASGRVPDTLRGKSLFSLNVGALSAGVLTSDEFVSRLQSVIAEAASARDEIILFIPELHQFVGTYATPAASAAVRDAISHGQLRMIGGASSEAYADYIANDTSLNNLFQPISIVDGVAEATASNENSDAENRNSGSDEEFIGSRVSDDLREMVASVSSPNERINVIMQVNDVRSAELLATLKRDGVLVNNSLAQLGTLKLSVPARAIEGLASSGLANYLSPDRQLESFGHITATTGTDLVRSQQGVSILGLLPTSFTLDGSGVGIAVLDSGMDTGHRAFNSRIVYSLDFTGQNTVQDN